MAKMIVDSKTCTGCLICAMTCSFIKEKRIDITESRIYVIHSSLAQTKVLYCTHCGNCISECPEGALKFDESTGKVTLQNELCNGCGLCTDACPSGYLRISPHSSYPLICDMCHGKPKCVTNCPVEAIKTG